MIVGVAVGVAVAVGEGVRVRVGVLVLGGEEAIGRVFVAVGVRVASELLTNGI